MKIVRRWWVLLMILGLTGLGGCQAGALNPLASLTGQGINVTREFGLAGATAVEISELANKPGMDHLRRATFSDPATVAQLVHLLDQRLPLGPPAACLPQYRLQYQLADGRTEGFDYFCEDGASGASFLRGSQPAWRMQEVRPPAEFDLLVQRLAARME